MNQRIQIASPIEFEAEVYKVLPVKEFGHGRRSIPVIVRVPDNKWNRFYCIELLDDKGYLAENLIANCRVLIVAKLNGRLAQGDMAAYTSFEGLNIERI